MMFRKAFKECGDMLLRRGWYRYDFFEGTNKGWLVAEYLLGRHRKDWVTEYEAAIARYVGVPYAITFGAGRMALYAILEALGIGAGDEVIVPAYTCVVVPNAILYRGAKPVYVDVRIDTFNIDVERIEKAITPRTKAIVAQHTFGQPCDIEVITNLARRHGITVIEDCAHAFGASFKGRSVGTFGDVAFASTDHSKVLSTSVGGFAVCAAKPLADKMRAVQEKALSLPWHCRLRVMFQYGALTLLSRPRVYWVGRTLVGLLGRMKVWFYFKDELETSRPHLYPVKLSNFQAFVGFHEMYDLQRNIDHRRAVARQYRGILRDKDADLEDGAWLRYSILVDSPDECERAMGKYFIVGRWFSSVAHGRTSDWNLIGYTPGECPTAEFVAAHIINFPTHFRIDGKAIRRFRHLVERVRLRAVQLRAVEAHASMGR